MVFFKREDFAFHLDRDFRGQIALRDGRRHLGDVAHLAGEVVGHGVDVVGQVLPGAGHALHCRLTAELAFGADLARHAADFGRKAVQLIDHGVERVLQLQNLALHVDGDLPGKVAVGHRGRHVGDVAHLAGEVGGHEVDVVGQILPGAGHARHLRLAAELAFGAHLARHARHFRREAVELIDHRVDRVLQLQDLATHVDRDLLGQVAGRNGRGDFGDVADLTGEVRGHRVDVVGQVLPRAGDAAHLRLAAKLALGADLARHARHFRGEAVELIDHRVDGVFQRENLALHIDRDLAREIALGDRGRHLGDVADLAREVRGHGVHRVGEILPRPGHTRHLCLSAELALGADLARHARHF